MNERATQINERIFARTVETPGPLPTPCWLWTGSHSGEGRGGGYPRMSLDGGTVAPHRVIWSHFNGYIPPKKQIDHRCNNRLCLNPQHLMMVTHRKNQKLRCERRVTMVEKAIEGFF
jgi:hypothetical protein